LGKAIKRVGRSLTTKGRAENKRRDEAKGAVSLLGAAPSSDTFDCGLNTIAEANATATRTGGKLELSASAKLSASYQAGVATSGEGYDFSADFLAQAVANAEAAGNFSYSGVDASAQLQLLVQADATAYGRIDTVAGSVAATAKAQAAVEAFAGAKAKLGKDGAMVSLGYHIGASVTAGVTFIYTSPSGALTITAAASVEAGVCLGGSVKLGVDRKGGAVTFAGKVAATAGAGVAFDLAVTIDAGKLKALVKDKVQTQVVEIQKKLEKLKKEESKRLLEPGFVKSDACMVAYEVEAVDVLALAAAAKALF